MRVDVVIVGSGPVALATAAILSGGGVGVVLLRGANYEDKGQRQSVLASRLLAISLTSLALLQKHNIAHNIRKVSQPINSINVVQYGNDAVLEFCPRDIGYDDFGCMIDEADLWRLLRADFTRCAAITALSCGVAHVAPKGRLLSVVTADGQDLRTELLIVADGKHSAVRKKLNFEVTRKDYHQIALVCDIRHSKHHQGVARELFMPAGPFATLPKFGGFESSVVWTESSDAKGLFNSLDGALLASMLKSRCDSSLGQIELLSSPSVWPLALTYAERAIGERTALIGDAMHSIHPLAGQGLNLGLRDVAVLTDLIIKAKNVGGDVGSSLLLSQYQSARENDIRVLISTVELINNIYKSKLPFSGMIGAMAIRSLSIFKPLRELFMRYAVGHISC